MGKNRILLVDTLRGIALAGILLVHHIEHFNFSAKPDYDWGWLMSMDKWAWTKVRLLVSGKSYALFSLLFGYSFWIIYESRIARGESYLLRHIWRMVLLFAFGLFHALFYRGDILMSYAVMGLLLIAAPYMNQRMILIVALFFLLDPVRLGTLINYELTGELFEYKIIVRSSGGVRRMLSQGTFWELVEVTFSKTTHLGWVWFWNSGRFPTMLGLFFWGVYLSQKKAFSDIKPSFWYRVWIVSLIGWLFFDLMVKLSPSFFDVSSVSRVSKSLLATYIRVCKVHFALALFVLLWHYTKGRLWLGKFSDFGRLGLTNYILMSIIGAGLYYGWGLGLYRYLGVFSTLLLAVVILIMQMKLSEWWLNRYGQGPLEKLWRYVTWVKWRG